MTVSDRLPCSQTYPVVETFHSLQGEGYWQGASAFFIRLAGCDVGCPWCDTKESWPQKNHPAIALEDLVGQVIRAQPEIVVITGGEPLMHDLQPLTAALQGTSQSLNLETSGSHPFSGNFDWVTLSPKPFKLPHPSVYGQVSEIKVVIDRPSDFEFAEAQSAQVSPQARRYLQPQWHCPESPQWICDYVRSHPQWRLSLQTHKFLGIR